MTGFGTAAVGDARWELRAVNGKGLDIRLRLPPGLDAIETDLRKRARARLSRGNVQAALAWGEGPAAARLKVDETALAAALDAVARIDAGGITRPSSAAEILALRGVLTGEDRSAVLTDDAIDDVRAAFDTALAALNSAREAEGTTLATVLAGQIDTIAGLADQARRDPAASPAAIHDRLAAQLASLPRTDGLSADRLAQEAAILATRADVTEELDRLEGHVAAARDLLRAGSPCGRKLEFLAQEFLREANTLCSKSPSTTLTRIGLELKSVIDQFREQVLNVE